MKVELESKRLLYRPLELTDAEALFEMDSNPNVHKYLWQKPTLNIDESIQIIEMLQKQKAAEDRAVLTAEAAAIKVAKDSSKTLDRVIKEHNILAVVEE